MTKCIGVYLRLSQEDIDKRTNKAKDESNSIMAQRGIVQKFIDSNPYLSGLHRIEFCDDGFTGTNFERPDFARMIDLVREGEINCIIVKDLSRFGRDYLDVGDYLEHIFPFLGVRIISINDGYDSENYLGNTAGMDVAFKNLIYDYYSKDLSKKVKTAMRLKQKNGGYVSACQYGYKVLPGKKHQMVIDPVTAPIVKRIFMDVIAGKSTAQVARELNAEGVPTPQEYKKITRKGNSSKLIWTHTRILDMLKNIKYTGCMVNHTRESRKIRDKSQRRVPKDEWFIHENAHEAIVTKEEFDLANSMLRKVRKTVKKPANETAPFYCSHCGRKLQRTFGNDVHFYCITTYNTDTEEPCENVRWDKEHIEEVLLAALKAQIELMEVGVRKKEQTTGKQLEQRLKALKDELEGGNTVRVQGYMDYREGRITKEEFLQRREQLEARNEELKETIGKLELEYEAIKEADSQANKDKAVVKQTSTMDDDALKMVMYDVIERVNFADKENIEIIWKFDDLFASA